MNKINKKKLRSSIKRGVRKAIAPALFTASSMVTAGILGELTDKVFTLYSLAAATAGAYTLYRSDCYLRHSYFHEDPTTPVVERRTLDTIIAGVLALEVGAISVASNLGPLTQEPQSTGAEIVTATGLLLGTYVLGRYAFTGIINYVKNCNTPRKILTRLAIPATAVLALMYATSLQSHPSRINGIPLKLEQPTHQDGLFQINQESPLTPIQQLTYSSQPPFNVWPVAVEESDRYVTSCFEWRGKGVAGGQGSEHHRGIDLRAPKGTPILAVGNGVVEKIENSWGYVIVNHGEGVHSSYGHLDTILVKEGSLLLAGQQLGTAGKKGTKQPHLHFQIIDESMPSGIQT
ncbi:MAG: M23 family metallopeptidase, partial [Candidatus Woesearchaeota archaeon]